MTPFTIELDRADIEFYCAGTKLKSQYIKKVKYSPGEISTLYISGEIESRKANHIAKYCENNESYINYHIEFNCKLHDFKKSQQNLDGIKSEFMNKEWRLGLLNNA